MLSVLFSATTITMNRGEQETLYRQSRNLRLQHEPNKAQSNKNPSLLPQQHSAKRHHSYGNIHQIQTTGNFYKQAMNLRYGDEQRPLTVSACDDLVLSVLKSPIRDQSLLSNLSSVGGGSSISSGTVGNRMSTATTLTAGTADQAPSPHGVGCSYSALQASEDDLADDVELAMETTELNNDSKNPISNSDISPYGLKFLRRFRQGRPPKFEAHHRRVPTPMRRKHNRGRSKSRADILDGVTTSNPEDAEEVMDVIPQVSTAGVPDPYYPIALPIDQAFKAKYIFHHRRGKTFQERMYVFLEHPCGWLCFVYHFTV